MSITISGFLPYADDEHRSVDQAGFRVGVTMNGLREDAKLVAVDGWLAAGLVRFKGLDLSRQVLHLPEPVRRV